MIVTRRNYMTIILKWWHSVIRDWLQDKSKLIVRLLDEYVHTDSAIWLLQTICITTVFVDTRLWKTKHPRKRFQNFRQSYTLSTDRIEIHQSQPASMTCRRSEGHTSGCNWWISIRSVDNTQDLRKFWKRFRGYFVFQSRVSTKTVVTMVACAHFKRNDCK